MKILDRLKGWERTAYLLGKAIANKGVVLVSTSEHADYVKEIARGVFKDWNPPVMTIEEYLEYLRDNPAPEAVYVDELENVLEVLLRRKVDEATRINEDEDEEEPLMKVTELNDIISKHSHVIVQYVNGEILAEINGDGPLPAKLDLYYVMLIEAVDNTLLITVIPTF